MSQTSFSIAYDGPAVESGAMDVRDLAPALLALGQLFDAANSVINEQRTTIGVNVRATSEGSFEVALDVVQSVGSKFVDIFSGDAVTAALQLKELVLVGGPLGVCLIWLVKKLRGGKPKKIEKTGDNNVRVTFDSETVEVPMDLLRLYHNADVRHALERLVKEPLEKDGIDKFEVRQDGSPVESVSASESDYFRRPDVLDEVVHTSTNTAAYSIVSLTFKEDNKWRLHDGNAVISALIADNEFLAQVESSRISFSKRDILICEVEQIQKRAGPGLKTEYTVLRVVKHKPAAHQPDLPIAIESDESPPFSEE